MTLFWPALFVLCACLATSLEIEDIFDITKGEAKGSCETYLVQLRSWYHENLRLAKAGQNVATLALKNMFQNR